MEWNVLKNVLPGIAASRSGSRYAPIAEHGAIGEGRSVALISSDGHLDWWSPGRFDAPSVFASILDADKGGHWSLSAPGARTHQRYVGETNVLETEHVVSSGRVVVHDALVDPLDSGTTDAVLVRHVRGVVGSVDLETEFSPRFHYGRILPRFAVGPGALLASGGGEIMALRSSIAWDTSGPGVRSAHFRVVEGETLTFTLRHAPFAASAPFARALAVPASVLVQRSIDRWRAWSKTTRAEGADASHIRRSALALKLLQYVPNGAFVAAATTSLPESIGGARNWDYRFTWLRDGVFTARALHDVGHGEDAARFTHWLQATLGDRVDDLHIMYTISGSGEIPEKELAHLEGHRESAPVRIGNAAALQRQLDVYGELVDYLYAARASSADRSSWPIVRAVASWVVDHWREPDQGIWEMRCEPRHFVLSKVMAWAALDRATRFAIELGEIAPPAWRQEADAIRAEVFTRGYDMERRTFVQAFGRPDLDASDLLIPLVGFVDARDPRMIETVDRILEELTVDGLVYRYLGEDGVPGTEATFAYCTFWLVEVLAMQGRVAQARTIFDRIVARASPVGLYAEEIDAATGEHLGNFPQAFPHAGLIQAARALRIAESAP